MKRWLLLLMLLWTALQAQIQVLPDIDVSGDSQIKIFLYKKALPYSRESIARDSISAFVPSSLPYLELPQSGPIPKSFSHYLHLQGDTSLGLDAYYKYYPALKAVSNVNATLSMRLPKQNMHSHHGGLGLDFGLDDKEALELSFKHFDTEMKGLDSEYTMASLTSYHDKLELKNLNIRQMSHEIRVYQIEQDNSGVAFKSSGLGFSHQSLLDFEGFTWGNRLYLYSQKPVLHSFIEVQQGIMDKLSLHVIQDGYSFFPVPGFHWRYSTNYDQQLSIVNSPETQGNDYYELLEEYRWLSLAASRRNTTIPLNLKIALEDTHPWDNVFLDRYLLANITKYKVNAPALRDSPNPEVPELYYSDVFSNESGISLSFGEGRLVFDQAIALSLSYMPNEDWLRQPYAPLLKVESTLVYQSPPFEARLGLNQHYFAIDHYQKPLPELLDICVNAAYDLNLQTQIYLKAENLLSSPKWQFKSLPRQDTSLFAGFVRRF
ncbi:MAG: hypothetical protein PHG34_05650 [Candidatus Cloacimonetes bacterium]|nr:hypothetical protein [Candidatus Cloacimonadota bacterium]MDD2423674.1 hypothetical protein [Candidatus Cloacimonadota bacterium]